MSKNQGISDEDRALFREAMRDVKPSTLHVNREKKPTNHIILKKHATVKPHSKPLSYDLSDNYYNTVQANTTLCYCHNSISKNRFKDIQNGKVPYEARLDLHGLTQDEARDTLCAFLTREQDLNKRCLLIIHGKGGRYGEAPILKNLVNHWLPQLPQVLAFHSALAKHGGTGAVYVLLKRQYP